jgi:uncharacterized protein (DUF302 family)
MYILMPKMMIVTHESQYDFDQTVSKIEGAIKNSGNIGWEHKGTKDLSEEVGRAGNGNLALKIKSIKLCNANYSLPLLGDGRSRFVSCLMPCSISVWESNEGKVYISKMNTGLVGSMFGGKISEIMGGKVGPDELKMLDPIWRK